jgi:hypothetical protein
MNVSSNKPFDRVLKTRAIMERVNSRLKPSEAVMAELPAEEVSLQIDPDLCFSPEADGFLEVFWAAPEFVPCWARPSYRASDLDMDDFSAFQLAEPIVIEIPAPVSTPVLEPSKAEPEIAMPIITVPQPVIQNQSMAIAVSAPKRAFRPKLGRKSAVAAMFACAALLFLTFTFGLKPAADNTQVALNTYDDVPLVDLHSGPAAEINFPPPDIFIPAVAAEPETQPEQSIEFITSEELLAELIAPPAPVEAAPDPLPLPKPRLLAQVGSSVKKIITSPTWATVQEELMIAPSAGDGEDEGPVTGYTLEAFPKRLSVGQATDVVFTLKEHGYPVTEPGSKIQFEENLQFPNLRGTRRYPGKNGSFTVKGLKA